MSSFVTEFNALISSLVLSSETSQSLSLLMKMAHDADISNSALNAEVDSRIDTIGESTTLEDLSGIVKCMKYRTPNRTLSVEWYSELAAIDTNDLMDGTMFFLVQYDIPVILNDGAWRTFDGRTLPLDPP